MKREDISRIFEGATQEQVNEILNINSSDIGKAKAKAEFERDSYKTQLDTAQTALKDFEGIDVGELQGKIATLTADLAKKDNDYKQQIADMEFEGALKEAITTFGAKNTKAVKALLDIDALKASKNQTEDIKKALEAVKADNDYMFISDEPIKNPVKDTGNTQIGGDPMEAMRAALGLPTDKK